MDNENAIRSGSRKAEPPQVERVLSNLLDNAVKYSPDGSEIKVFVRPRDGSLLIGVADQGSGISRADQSSNL